MPNTVLHKYPSVKDYLYYGFIFILVGLTVQSGDAAQGQSPAREQQTPASGHPLPEGVAVASPSPSQTAVQQPQGTIEASKGTQEKRSDDQSSFTDWVQVGINGALLVIIAFQTAIYWQQRSMMQRQIDNAKVSERAYIGVQQIANENLTVGAVPVVRLTLINGGRTPAYNLKTPGHMTITKDGLAFPHERPIGSKKESSTFLPAGSFTTINYPFTIRLTPTWLHVIQTGQYHVFLHVEVHFVDVWGDQQWTTFKFEYRPEDDRWGGYKDPEETKPIITIS